MTHGGLGAFVQRMDLGSLDRYSNSDVKDGQFNAGSMAIGIAYGTAVRENILMGIAAKLVQESIENESASGIAGDVGLLYRGEKANFGFLVQHLGTPLKMVEESNPLPLTVRAGASRRFLSNRLLGALEFSKPNDDSVSILLGSEYQCTNLFVLRGGFRTTPGNQVDVDGLTSITGGFGLQFQRFTLDYAIAPFGDLGISHRLSFLARFSTNK